MKRVRCPKCDNYITFDETRYVEGQTLVFECPECHRQFGIRIGTSTLLKTRKQEKLEQQQDTQALNAKNTSEQNVAAPDASPADAGTAPAADAPAVDCGTVVVVENVFHYRQELPLQLGDNVLGRYVRGTNINTPIETVDPSVDTTHCVINVRRDRMGRFIYTLRDAPSGTGTFVGNTILRDQDRLRIDHGTIITIGATTLILQAAGQTDEETTAVAKKQKRKSPPS